MPPRSPRAGSFVAASAVHCRLRVRRRDPAAPACAQARGAVRRAVAPLRALHPALVVLLVLAAAHGVAWAVVTAPLNGPDESAHFAYAQDLAENHHAPSRQTGTGSVSTEAARSTTAQPGADPAAPRGQADGQRGRPRQGSSSTSCPPRPARTARARTPPPTTRRSTTPTRPSPTSSRPAGRCWADVLHAPGHDAAARRHGLADVAHRRRALRAHVGAQRWPPGWSRCSRSSASARGIINPDLMLVMVATGALLMGIRLVRHGPTLGRVLWLAAFAGPERRRPPARALPAARSRSSRSVSRCCAPGRAGAAPLGFSAAVVGIAFAGVAIASRGRRPTRAARSRRTRSAASARASSWSTCGSSTCRSSASMRAEDRAAGIRLPPGLHRLLLQRVRLVQRQLPADRPRRAAGRRRDRLGRAVDDDRRALARVVARWREVAVCGVFFVGLMGLLHLVSYMNLRGSTDPVLTGRYLLPAVALYGCAIAWVASSLPRRLGRAPSPGSCSAARCCSPSEASASAWIGSMRSACSPRCSDPSSCWRRSRSARCGSTCRTSPRTTRTSSRLRRSSASSRSKQIVVRRRAAGLHQPGAVGARACAPCGWCSRPAARRPRRCSSSCARRGTAAPGASPAIRPGPAMDVEAAVSPAPPRDADGTLCLRNTGRRAVGLVGTDEPLSATLPATTIDGKPAGSRRSGDHLPRRAADSR